MKVELVDYQENAIDLLLYTKNTRLAGGNGIKDIADWPMEKKIEHLEYMKSTIQSSWEFVSYTFHISGVTRAFTHQLVRTRQGSYAQESQRTVDVRQHEIINDTLQPEYDDMAQNILSIYVQMIDNGVEVQDARGILPTNMTTEITVKLDLRTLHNMALVRLCTRTQGEYQRVFKAMKKAISNVHPWAEQFIQAQCGWNGICAFPNYTKCPIQEFTIKACPSLLDYIRDELEMTDHVANPVAKDGRTM